MGIIPCCCFTVLDMLRARATTCWFYPYDNSAEYPSPTRPGGFLWISPRFHVSPCKTCFRVAEEHIRPAVTDRFRISSAC